MPGRGAVIRVDDRVWRLEFPDTWHPGIVVDVSRTFVRAVFCSYSEPQPRDAGTTCTFDCEPFYKLPTHAYLRRVATLGLEHFTESHLIGMLPDAEFQRLIKQFTVLKLAGLI